MKRSETRFLTTRAGGLPRTPELCGVDVGNDGEQSRESFVTCVRGRSSSFGGATSKSLGTVPTVSRLGGSMRTLLALLLATGITACSGPTALLPGGALEGAVAPTPADWSFTDEVDTVQLETRAADPYSVNIWMIGLADRAYVHAGANRAAWVEHMEADPSVRLRVADSIYELKAERVTQQDEFDRFSDAYEQKYGNRPRNESVAEAYLFRLVSR